MITKKKLIIAGGGYADIPLILAAKKIGFFVITSGNRSRDLGHKYSDECHLEDFSDSAAMLRLCKRLGVDAICAACNDFSALSAAYVAERLGLPGHDSWSVAKLMHHKDLFRDFALSSGIPSPVALGFSDQAQAISSLEKFSFPLIIKPVDLTGGKGVSRVDDEAQASIAIEAAFRISKEKRVVVEEFIHGSRHGITTFIISGKVVFHFHDDEYYFNNAYMVSGASAPGSSSGLVVAQVVSAIEKMASMLRLKDGIVHVQYIETPEGNPFIIEVCRRAPGDLYIHLVKLATGIDYPSYIVKAAAGLDCSELEQEGCNGFFTRHCIMSPEPGVVEKVVVHRSVQENIIEQLSWWKEGSVITDCLTQKLGIVFMRFGSRDEMIKKTSEMQSLIRVQLR